MAEFEIPEDDLGVLFTAADIRQYDEFGNQQELPEQIKKSYLRYKAVKDRIDMGSMTATDLVAIILHSNWNVAPKSMVVTAATLGRSGELKHGDPITVRWRNKNQDAVFIGNCGDDEEVLVRLNIDSEERRVPTSTVKVLAKV